MFTRNEYCEAIANNVLATKTGIVKRMYRYIKMLTHFFQQFSSVRNSLSRQVYQCLAGQYKISYFMRPILVHEKHS